MEQGQVEAETGRRLEQGQTEGLTCRDRKATRTGKCRKMEQHRQEGDRNRERSIEQTSRKETRTEARRIIDLEETER